MRNCFVCTMILTACLFCSAVVLLAEEPTPVPVTQTTELFNGKNLDGWSVFLKGRKPGEDPNGVFKVEDGMIHISGEEFGGITTDNSYRDYHIIVEFKWGEKTWKGREFKARDSGLLFHSFGKDGGFAGIWMLSLEANITEGGMGDFWIVGGANSGISITSDVKEGTTRWGNGEKSKALTLNANAQGCIGWYGKVADKAPDEKGYRGPNDLDKPTGEWNRMEVVADGDTIAVWFNGKLVNYGYHARPSEGRIQLQSELAEIFYRRVTILPLKK